MRNLATPGGKPLITLQELFDLTPEDMERIETYLALSRLIKHQRKRARLSQTQLARLIGSDQATISRMETNPTQLSLDLLFKAAFAMGATRQQSANALGK